MTPVASQFRHIFPSISIEAHANLPILLATLGSPRKTEGYTSHS